MTVSFDVRVARRRAETDDITSLELEHLDGSPLPPFEAGAHIDLTAPNGMLRQYSLCGKPSERRYYLLGILRDPLSRGASEAIHQQLFEGDIVRISTPKNHFALQPASHSVLLAAGIGVTPLLCMAEQLYEEGASFELHYYAKSRERAAFLERIENSHFASLVTLNFDDEVGSHKKNLELLLGRANPGTHMYLCGPSGFIAMGREIAARNEWPASNVHFEHFSATKSETTNTHSFAVRIASSGKVFHIPPDKSITATLAEGGIVIPVSCQEGVCGTCITAVLAGEPDHRDCYFSEAEKALNNQVMPCCSRARSELLVLDL